MIIKHDSIIVSIAQITNIFLCISSVLLYGWVALHGLHNLPEDVGLNFLVITIESIFFLIMLIKFNTEYIPQGEVQPVRDHFKIAMMYA